MSTEDEPMKEVRKNFRISWYRCPIEPEKLRELTRRSDWKGLWQAVGHLALIAMTGVLTYFFFSRRIWLGFGLSLFAHSTFFAFLKSGNHELSHGTVFKTKWLNGFFLRLFDVLGWVDFHHYKMSHTYHHLYTLHPRGDREVVLPTTPSLHPLYLLQLFTFNIFGGELSFGIIPKIRSTVRLAVLGRFKSEWSDAIFADDQAEAKKKAVNWARFTLLFHISVIAVSIIFKLWLLPLLVTFGMFTGNWLRYFVGLPMHAGLRDNVPDFRKCVRTINIDPLSTFLYWRMNYHTEHHMFAAVPCYNLRKLQKVIASDMPKPRTLFQAWREMRTTWKRQQKEPGYQYDTPLPDSSSPGPEGSDSLSASLGDLESGTGE